MEFKDRKFEIHKVNNTCQCRLLLFMAVQAEMQMVLLNNQNWGWCKILWSALRLKYGDTGRQVQLSEKLKILPIPSGHAQRTTEGLLNKGFRLL